MARGGSSQGRGRGGGRSARPAGLNFDWLNTDGNDVELDFGPTPLFPKADIQPPKPLSKSEHGQVDHFLALKKQIRDSPIYAVIGKTSQIERYGSFKAAQVDPFEALPSYSTIYKKKPRTIPELENKSYDSRFFPRELWSTLGIRVPKPTGTRAKAPRTVTGKRKREEGEDDGDAEPSAKRRNNKLRRILDDDDDDDTDKEEEEDVHKLDDSDEPQDEEEVDDEFSDDSGDWNGENYFDGGEDYDDGGGDDGDGFDDTV